MASLGVNRLACGCLRVASHSVSFLPASSPQGALQGVLLRPLAVPTSRQALVPSLQPFSSSVALLKKRKVAAASNSPKGTAAAATPTDHDTSKLPQPDPENPLDLSSLIAAYGPADTHFKAQLQMLLNGGRFDPAHIGALPVTVKAPASEGGSVSTFPLRELAQVVPRSGRSLSLLVNERQYIKPVMSAVQASDDFNQQPQRAEDNELELILRVELERPEEVVRRAKDTVQGWREKIRLARTRHEKTLQEWKKAGTVLPDVVRKTEKEMQKVQDKKMKEIDQEEAQLIKQLERHAS